LPRDTIEIPQRQRSLDRLLALFAHLHRHGKPLSISELARQTDAPRSTTYELVRLLVEAELLEQNGAENTVFFGKMMYLYGMDFVREHDVVRLGRQEVDRLALETGETSQLCMLQGRQYTVVHMAAGARPFRISSDIGTQIPLPWTASGRLLLSHLSAEAIRAFVTPQDLVLPSGEAILLEGFIESVGQAREAGFCITSGLVDAFTHCIAAPIFGADRRVVATLCCVVPVDTAAERCSMLRDLLMKRGLGLSTPGGGQ
jgi:DNA-binding IclR family transcriptional regulator